MRRKNMNIIYNNRKYNYIRFLRDTQRLNKPEILERTKILARDLWESTYRTKRELDYMRDFIRFFIKKFDINSYSGEKFNLTQAKSLILNYITFPHEDKVLSLFSKILEDLKSESIPNPYIDIDRKDILSNNVREYVEGILEDLELSSTISKDFVGSLFPIEIFCKLNRTIGIGRSDFLFEYVIHPKVLDNSSDNYLQFRRHLDRLLTFRSIVRKDPSILGGGRLRSYVEDFAYNRGFFERAFSFELLQKIKKVPNLIIDDPVLQSKIMEIYFCETLYEHNNIKRWLSVEDSLIISLLLSKFNDTEHSLFKNFEDLALLKFRLYNFPNLSTDYWADRLSAKISDLSGLEKTIEKLTYMYGKSEKSSHKLVRIGVFDLSCLISQKIADVSLVSYLEDLYLDMDNLETDSDVVLNLVLYSERTSLKINKDDYVRIKCQIDDVILNKRFKYSVKFNHNRKEHPYDPSIPFDIEIFTNTKKYLKVFNMVHHLYPQLTHYLLRGTIPDDYLLSEYPIRVCIRYDEKLQ